LLSEEKMLKISEEIFYPMIEKWLAETVSCCYVGIRKTIWGGQPDVLGIKFSKNGGLKADLHLVEVKIIESVNSAYNLIGEVETRIAQFKMQNSVFHTLYIYMAIFEQYKCEEIRDYVNHRGIGLLKFKDHKTIALSLERPPIPITSGKTITINHIKDETWITDKDEARIFREAVKKIEWAKLRELIS